ncbi:MAG: toxic anion resistance protein [Bacillota bacterium]
MKLSHDVADVIINIKERKKYMGTHNNLNKEYILMNPEMKEEALDILDVSEEGRERIEAIKYGFDVMDQRSVALFGTGIQRKISASTEQMVQNSLMLDCEEIEQVLKDFMASMNKVKGCFKEKRKPLFSRISLFDKGDSPYEKYEKILAEVEEKGQELYKFRVRLLRETMALKTLYKGHFELLKELNISIMAGVLKKNEWANLLVEQGDDKRNSSYMMNNIQEQMRRLEGRIQDLRISRMILSQGMTQIQLSVDCNELLTEKIQNSILNILPLWKNQVAMRITRLSQMEKQKIGVQTDDTGERLLGENIKIAENILADTAVDGGKEDDGEKLYDNLANAVEELVRIRKKGF